jgi:ribosome-associated protein
LTAKGAPKRAAKPAAKPAAKAPAKSAVRKAAPTRTRTAQGKARPGVESAAKPTPKTPTKAKRAAKVTPERELAGRIVAAALDVKAEEALLYDLQGQSSIADYILICSGRSQGHVRGIADRIDQQLKAAQVYPRTIEGHSEGSWIVMDYSDVIVHVFHPETRLFYDLEALFRPFPHESFTAPPEPGAGRNRKP